MRSRTIESVVREVTELAATGIREVNLIAQDTTAYGTDIAPEGSLPELLSALDGTGVPWIRVLYTHPAHLTDEVLLAVSGLDSVVPYLDVPIQHISDRVLAAMGRHTDGRHVRSLFERIRRVVPGVSIRSSAMVGFPGETEDEFQELLDFVRGGNVDYLGVFEYSPEPGTVAFSLPERVEHEVATARARAIVEAMQEVTESRGRALVGRPATVLIDEVVASGGSRQAVGRTAGQAWEMDGIVLVEHAGSELEEGDFAPVRVTGADGFDLRAEPAEGAAAWGETA
jgi:ribosomal protein S12 methylthiotransferase